MAHSRAAYVLIALLVVFPAACARNKNPSSQYIRVTNALATGAGSFAAAVRAANEDHRIRRIDFASDVDSIVLREPLIYAGPQELIICGRSAVIDASRLAAGISAITSESSGSLLIDSLTIRNAPDVGIKVVVPASATGKVAVILTAVRVTGSGGHGLLVNDQAEYFQNPDTENNAGSAASLHVVIANSTFEKNGFGALDRDGVRLNEGGDGELRVEIVGGNMQGNGGDGVEIDERGPGSAFIDVSRTTLTDNGAYSSDDLDDGLDVDEFDDGDIAGSIRRTSATGNFDQGFDLTEAGAGDVHVDLSDVQAIGNRQPGIDLQELADGNLTMNGERVEVSRNGVAGISAQQAQPGVGTLNITEFIVRDQSVPIKATGVVVNAPVGTFGPRFRSPVLTQLDMRAGRHEDEFPAVAGPRNGGSGQNWRTEAWSDVGTPARVNGFG